MYEDELHAIQTSFDEILPVFNAVPKVVNIATALSVGGSIEPTYQDKEYIEQIIENLSLEQEKTFMAQELILGKSLLVEVQKLSLIEGHSEETAPMSQIQDFDYALSYYSANQYEIMSEGGEVLWAKVTGTKLVPNEEGDGYEEIEAEKVFFKSEDGTATSYILINGEKEEEVTYDNGKLPLVEITTSYDMKQLFYSIDRYNELECFIRNILYLAGEPIVAGSGVDKLTNSHAEAMGNNRYKKLNALFASDPEASIGMLEIKGSSATVMIEKQNALKESIIKDYPEYSISDVLSGSNVSEETTRIRLTEVLSRISEVKRNMELGINKIIAIIYMFENKDVVRKYITLSSVEGNSTGEILDYLKIALELGIISKRSAMYNIRTLFMGDDIDEEMLLIEQDIANTQSDTQEVDLDNVSEDEENNIE